MRICCARQFSMLITDATGLIGSEITNLSLQQGLSVVASVNEIRNARCLDKMFTLQKAYSNNLKLYEHDMRYPISKSTDLENIEYVIHTSFAYNDSPNKLLLSSSEKVDCTIRYLEVIMNLSRVKRIYIISPSIGIPLNLITSPLRDYYKPYEDIENATRKLASAFNKECIVIDCGFLIGPLNAAKSHHSAWMMQNWLRRGQVSNFSPRYMCDTRDLVDCIVKSVVSHQIKSTSNAVESHETKGPAYNIDYLDSFVSESPFFKCYYHTDYLVTPSMIADILRLPCNGSAKVSEREIDTTSYLNNFPQSCEQKDTSFFTLNSYDNALCKEILGENTLRSLSSSILDMAKASGNI